VRGVRATHREHAGEIQRRLGYHHFIDLFYPNVSGCCAGFTRAWLSAERPTVLFDLTTARLIERNILLPGVTVLTRLIARVRDRAYSRLWRLLAALPNADQRTRLEALLVVKSEMAIASRRWTGCVAPARISSPAMVDALNRLTELRSRGSRSLGYGAEYIDLVSLRRDLVPTGGVVAWPKSRAAVSGPVGVLQDSRTKTSFAAHSNQPLVRARIGLFGHSDKKHRFQILEIYFGFLGERI
jgi:hypothetical protein